MPCHARYHGGWGAYLLRAHMALHTQLDLLDKFTRVRTQERVEIVDVERRVQTRLNSHGVSELVQAITTA